MEAEFDAVKSNIAYEPGLCYVHESRQIESGQIGDDESEHRYFRNQ